MTGSANIIHSEEHDKLNVLSLAHSSGDVLLQSMNEQANKLMWWPFAAIAFVALFLGALPFIGAWPEWSKILFFAVGTALVVWTHHRDKLRRLTILFFEPDAPTVASFTAVVAGLERPRTIRKLRSVLETATYAETKYVAGAGQGLKLDNSSVLVGQAPGVLANINVPILVSGRTTLAFYPDRVLAFQGKAVGAVSYSDLQIESFPSQFIEKEALPGDASVVGQTWQYVNKKGGPDKRFKNNRQFPICRYNRLHLRSTDGLDVRLLSSLDGAFDEFARSVKRMAT